MVQSLRVADVVRAVIVAAIVGSALVLINHGDHLWSEPVCTYFWAKCGLSYATPFLVSLTSSALVRRSFRRARPGSAPP